MVVRQIFGQGCSRERFEDDGRKTQQVRDHSPCFCSFVSSFFLDDSIKSITYFVQFWPRLKSWFLNILRMSHQVKRIDKKLLPALHFHKKREFWIRKMSTHPLYYILLYIDIVVLHQNFTFFGCPKKIRVIWYTCTIWYVLVNIHYVLTHTTRHDRLVTASGDQLCRVVWIRNHKQYNSIDFFLTQKTWKKSIFGRFFVFYRCCTCAMKVSRGSVSRIRV